MAETTTRAYTLKLSGTDGWRGWLWKTHLTVNRGAQVWGDWLLTLRGGLPASLADDYPERRVLLSLSWVSVESPASLAPREKIIAFGTDKADDRARKVMDRFHAILGRLNISNPEQWIEACEPALTARIRDDAVWVDRSECYAELRQKFAGLSASWAADTLLDFLGGAEAYFAMPDDDAPAVTEAKDFVQKAGGWLSRNWGSGEKSDSTAISSLLARLADADPSQIVGKDVNSALVFLLEIAGCIPPTDAGAEELFKQLKQAIGWKGRPSKGAIALEKIRDAAKISDELWRKTIDKFKEEGAEQAAKSSGSSGRPAWMESWRPDMEQRLGVPYRANRDLIWEHGVTLDHALRRVSAAHTWIKRAEVERRRFKEDAAKLSEVPSVAQDWLNAYCEKRSHTSGAIVDYLIRKRAIDGWDKIVRAWADLGEVSTRAQRIDAARAVQTNLDENEKFGDIQLFAGFGDEDKDDPEKCLADNDACCVWRNADSRPDADILKKYVAATVADHDQRRFKVPAYRHPDPLRHPVYVDFGNSRWGIAYSALDAARGRRRLAEKLPAAKTDRARAKMQAQLDALPDLRGVSLDVWDGNCVAPLALRWHGKRLWKDLDLKNFGNADAAH
jgi:hypothetical protein